MYFRTGFLVVREAGFFIVFPHRALQVGADVISK